MSKYLHQLKIECHYTCGSCNDFGSNNCTLCLPSSHRYLTLEGKCLCKSSYFDDQTDSIVCACIIYNLINRMSLFMLVMCK